MTTTTGQPSIATLREIEAKYGTHLQTAFQAPGGEALRSHIDSMPNEAYQHPDRRSAGCSYRAWTRVARVQL